MRIIVLTAVIAYITIGLCQITTTTSSSSIASSTTTIASQPSRVRPSDPNQILSDAIRTHANRAVEGASYSEELWTRVFNLADENGHILQDLTRKNENHFGNGSISEDTYRTNLARLVSNRNLVLNLRGTASTSTRLVFLLVGETIEIAVTTFAPRARRNSALLMRGGQRMMSIWLQVVNEIRALDTISNTLLEMKYEIARGIGLTLPR